MGHLGLKVFNPKSTELFSPGAALGVFSISICKIRSRHPRELKLTGLIACNMFYKISTITNDVIMMSLSKQWQNSDLRETKQIIYYSKGDDETYPKMYFFIEFEPPCRKLWAFCQILVLFTRPAYQI